MAGWAEKNLPQWDGVIFCIVLFYFALRLVFLATSIATAIAPDEAEHIKLIELYNRYPGFVLPESAATASLDMATHRPHLYFWLMGKALHLNVFSLPSFLFLRLVHVLLSLVTALISWRFFRLLTADKAVSLLAIIVLTNIPMYSFLAAFVSYDNVINLLSVSCFYFLFKFLKGHEARDLYGLLIAALPGPLIKFTFLPLWAIFAMILAIDGIKNSKDRAAAESGRPTAGLTLRHAHLLPDSSPHRAG